MAAKKPDIGLRQAKRLCNMTHEARLTFIAEGLPIILKSAQGFWDASRSLKDRPREAEVLAISRLTRICCGTPAASPWPMPVMTHGPFKRILATATSNTRSGTPNWRRTDSKISGGDRLGPAQGAGLVIRSPIPRAPSIRGEAGKGADMTISRQAKAAATAPQAFG
jgi:hypothetical protein